MKPFMKAKLTKNVGRKPNSLIKYPLRKAPMMQLHRG